MEANTVKTETDIGVPGEGDFISMEPDDVYIASAFSKEKYDPEVNGDAVKVERDVDVVGEEDCTDMKTEEVYRPSVLSVKTECENCTDVLEAVPHLCTEMCVTASDDGNKDIKVEEGSYVSEEEDPLAVTLPATKAEEENCTDVLEAVPHLCTEMCVTACDDGNKVTKVEEGSYVSEEEDPLAVTLPATKAEEENIDIEDELTHVDVHPYSCGVCNKSYINQNSLRKHKRIHSEAQAFSCDVCNKLFMYENDLEEHQSIHTDERPYTCSVCNKSFSNGNRLKKHQRIHTGYPNCCRVSDICPSNAE